MFSRRFRIGKGFDVGESDDFEQEVEATSENKALMALLAARRSNRKRVSLADVKKDQNAPDLEIINQSVDRLNQEAMDVLAYQVAL